ncbi:MAG: hypothetical protein HY293_14885 [Planctomycetes bacterium]|nr:hypothetical protein [Planctomycetota bacterium]
MLRWTALLAIGATALLVAFLIKQTYRAELTGPVVLNSRTDPDLPASGPEPSGTRWVGLSVDEPPLDEWFERLVLAGLSMSGHGEGDGSNPMKWVWYLQVPEDLARDLRLGDRLQVRSMSLYLPGKRGDGIRHRRYDVERGGTSKSFEEPGNLKFFLAWGAIAGTPLAMWATAVAIILGCGGGGKTPSPVRD